MDNDELKSLASLVTSHNAREQESSELKRDLNEIKDSLLSKKQSSLDMLNGWIGNAISFALLIIMGFSTYNALENKVNDNKHNYDLLKIEVSNLKNNRKSLEQSNNSASIKASANENKINSLDRTICENRTSLTSLTTIVNQNTAKIGIILDRHPSRKGELNE